MRESRWMRPVYWLGLWVLILTVVLGYQAIFKVPSDWQDVYVLAGRQLWAGEHIYYRGTGYLYPPFMAMLAAPFSVLPEWASRLGWLTVNGVAMIVIVAGSWRLAAGPVLGRIQPSDRGEWIAFAVGLTIGLTYILNAIAHQQTDVFIGALLIGGALALQSHRDTAGGVLLGVATACKATPLLWAPYLIWRQRWIALVTLGATAAAVSLAPDLIARSPRGSLWIWNWLSSYVLPTLQPGTPLGTWGSALEFNQALGGTTQRLVNTTLALTPEMKTIDRPMVDATIVKIAVYALFVILIAVSVVAATRDRKRTAVGRARRVASGEVHEFSIVLILMLLMSPMSGRAHFVTLTLPAFSLARHALISRDRMLAVMVGAAACLSIVANKDLVGATVYGIFLWLGSTTACALLLWLGSVYVLWRGTNDARDYANGGPAYSLSAA